MSNDAGPYFFMEMNVFMEICNGTYCIYIHTNKINGKMYVGQTIHGDKPNERWKNGKAYKGCDYFYHAIQKYGWSNFEHEIVANNLTAEEADNFERLLIKILDLRNPNKGYNLESGGTKNKTHSESTKQKISEANKGVFAGNKNPMYGISPKERMDDDTYFAWREKIINLTTSDEFRQQARERNVGKKYSNETNKKKGRRGSKHHFYGKHHTDESKEKIRQANLGKTQSDETKRKISEAMQGENNPFYGKKHSDETKKKISEANKGKIGWNKGIPLSDEQKKIISDANKGRKASDETRKKMSEARRGVKNPNTKKVIQYDKDGSFIRIWDYIQQASDELGVNRCCIGDCCRGVQKTAGGFIWKYYIEEDSIHENSVGI